MLDLVRVKLTVIAYVTEENARVVKALQYCLPNPLRSKKLEKQSTQSQFGDPLTIYSFETNEEEEIKQIIEYYADELDDANKDYLKRNLMKKVDFDTRSLYLRFDKFKAYQESLEIEEGGDVIRVEISYAAYTKDQNSLEEVNNTFATLGLIEAE